jgi:hypothetical protein
MAAERTAYKCLIRKMYEVKVFLLKNVLFIINRMFLTKDVLRNLQISSVAWKNRVKIIPPLYLPNM